MFKRVFSLLIAILLLLSLTACLSLSPASSDENVRVDASVSEPKEEILFRNIPWGSNPNVANNLLGGEMLLSEDFYIKDWSCAYDIFSAGVCPGGHALIGSLDEVAGYPVFMTTLYFMYSLQEEIDHSIDASEFYLANYQFDVADVDAAYDDLKNKLTDLYGTGTEKRDTVTHSQWAVMGEGYSGKYDTLERCTTWIGGNNTQIVLMCSSLIDDVDVFNGNFLLLTYGKTDIDQRLESLTDALWEEMKQAERANQDPQNNNGL